MNRADPLWNVRVLGGELRARVLRRTRGDAGHALIEREDGQRFLVPVEAFTQAPGGGWSVSLDEARRVTADAAEGSGASGASSGSAHERSPRSVPPEAPASERPARRRDD